jgi:hypothetical protein
MAARRTMSQIGHSTEMPAIHKQNHALTAQAEHLSLLAKERSPSPDSADTSNTSERLRQIATKATFWIEAQFGKRLCSLIDKILRIGSPAVDQKGFHALDRLLGHLVRLGISEAHQAETLLRTLKT